MPRAAPGVVIDNDSRPPYVTALPVNGIALTPRLVYAVGKLETVFGPSRI